jgi:hypothetical protein
MAILSNGILGSVSGKTGPVISYTRYGQNITRTVGSTRKNKTETPARKAQRDKIKVCNQFTKAFAGTHFFDRTFPDPTHTGSGYNRATSALMNLAIVTLTETIISWPKVLISKGEIAPVDSAAAAINEEENIMFTWVNNAGTGTAKGTDKAILVAYFHESKEVAFKFSEATRNEGVAVLEMNSKKGNAETWLGFLSSDEKNAANSIYCGRVALI